MKQIIIIAAILILGLQNIHAQQKVEVKWLTFEEAEKLDSTDHRPFLIDVYRLVRLV